MKLNKKVVSVIVALGVLCSMRATAFAEETQEVAASQDLTAVWIEPSVSTEVSWLDGSAVTVSQPKMEIVAAGGGHVILKKGAQYVLTDSHLAEEAVLAVPAQTQWIGVDAQARILAFDGAQLYFAQSPQAAAASDGFVSALKLDGVTKIDHVDSTLVYADDTLLTLADLNALTRNSVPLADFFDDAKVAEMTPEAVTATAKKKAKKSTKSTKDAQNDHTLASIEVQTLVTRADGTVVLRVRQMLQTRTFVSHDKGLSWTLMLDSPNTIVKNLGWIWDGQNRVLSSDGTSWMTVCGAHERLLEHYVPSQRPASRREVTLSETYPESPVVTSDETATAACVEVPVIPAFSLEAYEDMPLARASYLSPIEKPRTGVRYYFTAETSVDDASQRLWQVSSKHDGKPVRFALPDACEPLYVESTQGLGVLLCKSAGNDRIVDVYTQSGDTGWFREASLSAGVARGTRMHMASDGTLTLAGDCEREEIQAQDATFDEQGNIVTPAVEASSINLCTVAVRANQGVGSPEIWRLDRVQDAEEFAPMNGGRVLALVRGEGETKSIVESNALSKTRVVDQFDASAYDGIQLTNEGCLALYDKNASSDQTRLLTPEGHLATSNCETAKAITIAKREAAAKTASEAEYQVGDSRYGLRLGGGAFFASGVITWSMRVEGLIPVYGGQYEVGLMFRMAGGNKNGYMGYLGMVSARWRYDQLELFDFAVGAGIGFGQLTGYAKETEEVTADGVTKEKETKKSESYQATNALSLRYLIGGVVAYKLSSQWKIYLAAELIGGSTWGFDLNAGIEIRF